MPAIIACHSNSYGHLGRAAAIENVGAAGLEYIEFPTVERTVPSPDSWHDRDILQALVLRDKLGRLNQCRCSDQTIPWIAGEYRPELRGPNRDRGSQGEQRHARLRERLFDSPSRTDCPADLAFSAEDW